MKGLILKDLYMMKAYCKAYLLIAAVFIAVSFFGDSNLLFIFYPCMLCGVIPVNLLGYDERSRWMQYSESMPYTKAQIVSCKYLIGLGTQIIMMTVTGIAQAIRMHINGTLLCRRVPGQNPLHHLRPDCPGGKLRVGCPDL